MRDAATKETFDLRGLVTRRPRRQLDYFRPLIRTKLGLLLRRRDITNRKENHEQERNRNAGPGFPP